MKRIKYLIKKLFSCNYKDMYIQAKNIHKKRGKPTIYIFLDMLNCGIFYGAGYSDYVEFEFDLLNSVQRKTYLTSELNNRIVKNYNDKNYFHIFQNKIEFNYVFKDFIGRDFLDLQNSRFVDFKKFVTKHKKICVKPINLSCGEGIEFFKINNSTNLYDLYNYLKNEKKFLVEEYVNQHKNFKKLYNGSVNTLRIISFLDEFQKPHILKSVMKFGTTGNIDNHVAGGMYTFLDDNGKVIFPACDDFGHVYFKHPVTHVNIVGFKVPYFKETLELVKRAALVVPKMRYIGWDVAITDHGPLIIEGNEYSGLFQNKASTNPSKTGDLPIFKKYIKF